MEIFFLGGFAGPFDTQTHWMTTAMVTAVHRQLVLIDGLPVSVVGVDDS
jgi:hypothetical protein